MNAPIRPAARNRQRCAVYTRVSTEHGLDMEFNSLDAQREACEAYITSQKHEGWSCLPHQYNDGGFSGGSLDRPDLQRLMADIRAGRLDIIVVYKVDRLTRSLADFAKLVELFDAHGVSFVSVTQSFNTTSSMGRLTLNVLLSFAQFEREVTGERIRDKIAASKKKGIRMGGPVPLGYALKDKRLVLDEAEAATVRHIFAIYLETGALGPTLLALEREGIVTKRTMQKGGVIRGGVRFGKGALRYLLRNRVYTGEISHKGVWYPSDHPEVIDVEIFKAVQARLDAAAVTNTNRRRAAGDAFPLAGRIFDDRGNRMTPTFARKNGAHYRYYVCAALHQGRRSEAGSISRVNAGEIEEVVAGALEAGFILSSAGATGVLSATPSEKDAASDESGRTCAKPYLDGPGQGPTGHLRAQMKEAGPSDGALDGNGSDVRFAKVKRVTVRTGHLRVEVETTGASGILDMPWSPIPQRRAKGAVANAEGFNASSSAVQSLERRVADIARARKWVDDLAYGRADGIAALAARDNLSERLIRLKLDLAFTAPTAIRAMIRQIDAAEGGSTGNAQVEQWRMGDPPRP